MHLHWRWHCTIDAAAADEAAFAAITTVASGATLSVTNYVDGDLSDLTNNGTVNVTTANSAVLADDALSTADEIPLVLALHRSMQQPMKLHLLPSPPLLLVQPSVTNYVDGDLSDLTNNGTVNVTTANSAVLADDALSTVDAISIGAGTASIDAAAADEAAFAAITTVASGATLSVTNYVDGDLSDLTNNGTVNVTTADTAVLADDALSTASAISIGAGTASIDAATADEAAFAAITTVASGGPLGHQLCRR